MREEATGYNRNETGARGWGKEKSRAAKGAEKSDVESRHDDLLWKDLLARFFVPMLCSLLPDLARDIAGIVESCFLGVYRNLEKLAISLE